MSRLIVLSCLSLLACGGTERTRTTFPVQVSARSSGLVTDSGWSVTLTKATAHLASVRFFSGKAQLARATPWWHRALISNAYAHPGHYAAGEALGEVLATLDADLLAGPTEWGVADGVTGAYGSLQLGFAEGGLEVEGTATKGADTVAFSTRFTPPAPLEGAAFSHEMTTSPGRVDVQLDLSVVFSRIDFALVGSGAKPLDTMSPAFNGYARGIEDVSAYVTTWSAQ